MSVLTKKLHILKTGGSEQTANIYTTEAECPSPNLKVNVDGTNGFIKLGDVTSPLATNGRVHVNSNNVDYAILSSAAIRDFPNEWGAFQNITFTTSRAVGNQHDWMYVWNLRFASGCLPMYVFKDGTAPVRDDNLFVWGAPQTITVSGNERPFTGGSVDGNSGAFKAAAWANLSSSMKWYNQDGSTMNMISYTDATLMGWNNDNNVIESSYMWTATVSGGQLLIYKNGALFKTYNI